jgi:dihydroorotase
MQFLLKSVKVLDSQSTYYHKVVDIEFSHGKISQIADSLPLKPDFQLIEGKELCIATGFIDMNAQSGEPHFSVAENMASLEHSAAKGGFTHVCHFPSENHAIENESDVYFLKSKNRGIVNILPVGSITQKKNAKNMAELYDMHTAGAVAFSNGNEMGIDADTLINTLNYTKSFGGKLLIHAEKNRLTKNGQVNQGLYSLMTGFKGIPKEAELLAVKEVVELAKYTQNFPTLINISTAESLEYIREIKKEFPITCGISSIHLALNDEKTLEFDTFYKVNPPLRSETDRKALCEGVLDGTIDFVYSQHIPWTEEEKHLEFDLAAFGIINLQTSFLLALQHLGKEAIEPIIRVFSSNPAAYLNLNLGTIAEGKTGSFTLFDLEDITVFSNSENKSKSKNSPFFGSSFQGKIKGIIHEEKALFF